MNKTRIFLNAAQNGAKINNSFDSLDNLFEEIENQCIPFYYRLARFIALNIEKDVALEKGFVFNDEGEPVFSKQINKNIDKYLKNILDVSERVLRYWKTLEDYAMFRRTNRNRFFKLAFILGLNASQTNDMFNKLFSHPAFIREPEALIFMRCLDKKKTFEYAENMVKDYFRKAKIISANEVFERIHTSDIYKFECSEDDEYTTYLAANRKQFEFANVTAVEKIKDLADTYISREFYKDKLENIDYVFSEIEIRPDEGWEGMEDCDNFLYENETTRNEEIKSILSCFPLFLSVLSKNAPEINGKLIEAFYNNAGIGTDADGEFDAKIFSEFFNDELNLIDISKISSTFLRRAFSGVPNIKMIYDEEKLNNYQIAKFTKYECLRKLLIMMSFLEFHTEDINGTFEDSCNIYLAQCGFGELYAPNPFDFMFLLASNAKEPIDALRTLWDYAFSLGTTEQ